MRCRGLSCLLAGALALAGGGAQAEVKIGFANPLSGAYALSGARNRIAVEMAVRRLNDAGGVLGEPVALVAVDDACGLERSIEAARAAGDGRRGDGGRPPVLAFLAARGRHL